MMAHDRSNSLSGAVRLRSIIEVKAGTRNVYAASVFAELCFLAEEAALRTEDSSQP